MMAVIELVNIYLFIVCESHVYTFVTLISIKLGPQCVQVFVCIIAAL